MMKRSLVACMIISLLLSLSACVSGPQVIPGSAPPIIVTKVQQVMPTEEIKKLLASSPQLILGQGNKKTLLPSKNPEGQPDVAATIEYLDQVVKYADRVWTTWFTANGLDEPWIYYQIVPENDRYISGSCHLRSGTNIYESDAEEAVYCPGDLTAREHETGMIILPAEGIAHLWDSATSGLPANAAKDIGDLAGAALVAQLVGMRIEHKLAQVFGREPPKGLNAERMGDCFAGAILSSAKLAPTAAHQADIQRIVDLLTKVNKFPGAQGDIAQRVIALKIGLYGLTTKATPRSPAICINNYWPELTKG